MPDCGTYPQTGCPLEAFARWLDAATFMIFNESLSYYKFLFTQMTGISLKQCIEHFYEQLCVKWPKKVKILFFQLI